MPYQKDLLYAEIANGSLYILLVLEIYPNLRQHNSKNLWYGL